MRGVFIHMNTKRTRLQFCLVMVSRRKGKAIGLTNIGILCRMSMGEMDVLRLMLDGRDFSGILDF